VGGVEEGYAGAEMSEDYTKVLMTSNCQPNQTWSTSQSGCEGQSGCKPPMVARSSPSGAVPLVDEEHCVNPQLLLEQ